MIICIINAKNATTTTKTFHVKVSRAIMMSQLIMCSFVSADLHRTRAADDKIYALSHWFQCHARAHFIFTGTIWRPIKIQLYVTLSIHMHTRHIYILHIADALLSPSNCYCIIIFKVNWYQNNSSASFRRQVSDVFLACNQLMVLL